MRLLNTSTLRLTEFIGTIPYYAILSHTWETEEVLFEDLDRDPSRKTGWKKVVEACKIALKHRYDWIWIDTCCISKSSSAELSESINSMFKWYEDSNLCIAYLSDVSYCPLSSQELFDKMAVSRWFTRGWTLQELLAPDLVEFYSSDWRLIASRTEISSDIASITGIGESYLTGDRPIDDASVARRMSWASKRKTTRVEDIAYCLLGLFQVHMPLIYGEGKRAFTRLQEAILREVDDQSIFAWGRMTSTQEAKALFRRKYSTPKRLLADSPKHFEHAGDIITFRTRQVDTVLRVQHGGIAVSAPFWKGPELRGSFSKTIKTYGMFVPLRCRRETKPLECIALCLASTSPTAHKSESEKNRISCSRASMLLFTIPTSIWKAKSRRLLFMFEGASSRRGRDQRDGNGGFLLRTLPRGCRTAEVFPQNDPRTILPFRFRTPKEKKDETKELSPPTIVRLQRWALTDLALVLQTWNTEHCQPGDRFSPEDIVTKVVMLPTWKSLNEVEDVIERENECWSPDEMSKWRGACNTSESKVDRPAARAAGVLRRSELELFDVFHVSISQDISYGDSVFLLDIKDSRGGNISLKNRCKL